MSTKELPGENHLGATDDEPIIDCAECTGLPDEFPCFECFLGGAKPLPGDA